MLQEKRCRSSPQIKFGGLLVDDIDEGVVVVWLVEDLGASVAAVGDVVAVVGL